MPDETLLSHDLFESVFARAALVSDIEFLDDYPARYDSYALRQHRWTRGDWQIAGWLLRTRRDAGGTKTRNRIPAISPFRPFALAGGLMSYGPDLDLFFRRTAFTIDRILKEEVFYEDLVILGHFSAILQRIDKEE